MLRVSLLGNLGADPESRFTAKGTQIVTFRVAVNQVRTGPDGERQENTEWFRVRIANRQAEYVQRLGKGARVLVIGRLDIGHYTSKEGEQRTSFDVWADEVQSMATRAPSEPFSAVEGEADSPEPALAGVSSLSGPPAAARGPATLRPARGGARAAAAAGPSDDLEDLPF